MNFSEMLHEQRGKLLAEMPPNARIVLSAGCSGGWYFDWFTACYGEVEQHIGVELYSPKPNDLPTNVKWIANSVAKMTDVADGIVDMVFSGQNVEHLPEQDLLGFLLESNRVLRVGGALIIDSPNRDVTLPFGWIQPEHTLEFSVSEMERMIKLAGFEITAKKGLWHCGGVDSLWEDGPDNEAPNDYEYRTRSALSTPTESFIWWIEAKKVTAPKVATLGREISRVYRTMMPVFIATRFRNQIGTLTANPDSEISVEATEEGFALYGPYIPLTQGKYEVRINLNISHALAGASLRFDMTSAYGQKTEAALDLPLHSTPYNQWVSLELQVELKHYSTAVETRVFSNGVSFRLPPRASIRSVDQHP